MQPRLSPFEFDLQSQTFPQLCLQVLPPPPSLFSSQPFASATSFPLEPPGLGQLEPVRQNLCAQIEQWKSDQLTSGDSAARLNAGRMSFTHNTFSNSPDSDMIASTARQHEEMTVRHLDLALKHWMALPRAVQQETWQLEITRAFAREVEKRKKTDAQLVRVQQEANQLRAQVDRLGSCQWPREFAIFPPDTLPIPRDAAGELGTDSKTSSSRWDFDNVVAKWKRVVMHDKGMGRSGTNFSHNAAVVTDDKKKNNKRGNTNNNNNTNRPGSSRVAAMNAPSSVPNSPLEGSRQPQQASSSYSQDPKRNSALGPQPKRQRLNGQGKNTDGDNTVNGSVEHNSTSGSPGLAQMPPPHSRPGNASPTNVTASNFRHYNPANGEKRQDTEQMDVDAGSDGADSDDDGDGDGDADADGEADADGDSDGDEEDQQDSSAHNENGDHRPSQHNNQQKQQQHGGGGSGTGNFDGPRVLMDMRARGVQP